MSQYIRPILGQPVVSPDGFGKVVGYVYAKPTYTIRVRNDLDNVERDWDANNVSFVKYETRPFARRPQKHAGVSS